MKNVNVSTEVTRCSCVSFKSHFVVYMWCFFSLCGQNLKDIFDRLHEFRYKEIGPGSQKSLSNFGVVIDVGHGLRGNVVRGFFSCQYCIYESP